MYKKGTGNDKQGKDAENRTLCPYRNFSQAINTAEGIMHKSFHGHGLNTDYTRIIIRYLLHKRNTSLTVEIITGLPHFHPHLMRN